MEKTSVRLNHPIQVNGQQIVELQLRRPKVRDRLAVEKMNGADAEKEIRFIANLCEVAPTDIEELDMSDYARVQDALTDFLS
jgi:hypothetical protein